MAEFITNTDGTKAARSKEIEAVYIQAERVSEEVTNYNIHIRLSWLVFLVFETLSTLEGAKTRLDAILGELE